MGLTGGLGWQLPIKSNLELEVGGTLFHLFARGSQGDIDLVVGKVGLKLTF